MRSGGRYEVNGDGEPVLVEPPTARHAAGDAPRTQDGELIGADGLPVPQPAGPPAPDAEG